MGIKQYSQKSPTDIAVIGMACRFPGAKTYRQFWENLANGICSIKEITPDRWDAAAFYSPDIHARNKSITKWLGAVDDVDCFDHQFFSISPKEAAHMDPQQRLILEETWHCIEDSGVSLKHLQENKTGVFVGVSDYDYLQLASDPDVFVDEYSVTGSFPSIISNRISQVFNFTGESLTLDTACSACLYAVREARRSLIDRECGYALVASAHIDCHPFKYLSFSKLGIFSPRGSCHTFDKDADGIVLGEGVGVLLICRLDDALKRNNHIYGVIKGVGVNHSGLSVSLTAPRLDAQKEVIVSACRNAQINPETVTYIEAHGTGTALGDPIEVEALTQAFRDYTDKRQFCKIGSVKPNIGHLGGASGIASLIKVLLMFHHRKIPPNLHFKTPNPVIEFNESPFQVATELTEWQPKNQETLLRAGVSAFGFGGANAHIILEESPKKKKLDTEKSPFIFILSAKTEQGLRHTIARWKDFIRTHEFFENRMEDICYTLAAGREAFPYRYGCSGTQRKDVELCLENPPTVFEDTSKLSLCIRIGRLNCFGFSKIGADIQQNILFRNHLEQVEHRLSLIDQDLCRLFRKTVWADSHLPLFSFIADYSYLNMLFDLGVSPDMITCTRNGMWTALAVSGMISLEDALSCLAGYKSWQSIRISRPIVKFYDPVCRHILAPFHIDESYIRKLISGLRIEAGVFDYYMDKARRLVDHQPFFKKSFQEWSELFQITDEQFFSPQTRAFRNISEKDRLILSLAVVSSLHRLGRKWNLKEPDRVADKRFYELLRLILDDVLPKESFIRIVRDDSADLSEIVGVMNQRIHAIRPDSDYRILKQCQHLTEIGDIPAWIEAISETRGGVPDAPNRVHLEIGTTDEVEGNCCDRTIRWNDLSEKTVAEALTTLWLHGQPINWQKIFPEDKFQKTPLPVYPFSGKRFWISRTAASPELTSKESDTPKKSETVLPSADQQPEPADRKKIRLKERKMDQHLTQGTGPGKIILKKRVEVPETEVIHPDICCVPSGTDSLQEIRPAQLPVPQTVKQDESSIKESLPGDADEKLRSSIENQLIACVDAALGSDVESIGLQEDFLSHGIDSIIAVEIINHINEIYHISLDAAKLLEFENVKRLADFILQKIAGKTDFPEIIKPGHRPTLCESKSEGEAAINTNRLSEEHETFENFDDPKQKSIEKELPDEASLIRYIEETIAAGVNSVMGQDVNSIGLEEDFLTHGIDSIMAVEIINYINDIFHISLNASILLESENIRKLAGHIYSEYGQKIKITREAKQG